MRSKGVSTAMVFGWRALLDRLLSRANLERTSVGVGCNLCLLCNKEVETIQHLFITCKVAQHLWIKCDNWLGITSVTSNDVKCHFCGFSINKVSTKVNKVSKGMWLTLVKEIWTHRNRVISNNGKVDEVKIFVLAQMHG